LNIYLELAKHINIDIYKGDVYMPKDSQPDNKYARLVKSNYDTPITRESAKNQNNTTKKQSADRK
jgi:hypothetical protein